MWNPFFIFSTVDDYSPNVTQPGSLQGSSTSFNPLCFSFTAVDDSLPDDGESFSVELLATDGFTSGFQIGNDRVDITILDSATPPPPTVDLEGIIILGCNYLNPSLSPPLLYLPLPLLSSFSLSLSVSTFLSFCLLSPSLSLR